MRAPACLPPHGTSTALCGGNTRGPRKHQGKTRRRADMSDGVHGHGHVTPLGPVTTNRLPKAMHLRWCWPRHHIHSITATPSHAINRTSAQGIAPQQAHGIRGPTRRRPAQVHTLVVVACEQRVHTTVPAPTRCTTLLVVRLRTDRQCLPSQALPTRSASAKILNCGAQVNTARTHHVAGALTAVHNVQRRLSV